VATAPNIDNVAYWACGQQLQLLCGAMAVKSALRVGFLYGQYGIGLGSSLTLPCADGFWDRGRATTIYLSHLAGTLPCPIPGTDK